MSFLLTTTPLKIPLILQLFLSVLFSPSHYLLSSFSKESTQSTLLSVAHSFKFQVPLDKLCKTIWERGRNVTHTFVGKNIVLQKSSEERYKETQVLLTLKFKITSLCRKWGNSLLICFPYIVFSPYPKSILRVVVIFQFHKY